jgi:hypothetical protein
LPGAGTGIQSIIEQEICAPDHESPAGREFPTLVLDIVASIFFWQRSLLWLLLLKIFMWARVADV